MRADAIRHQSFFRTACGIVNCLSVANLKVLDGNRRENVRLVTTGGLYPKGLFEEHLTNA